LILRELRKGKKEDSETTSHAKTEKRPKPHEDAASPRSRENYAD